MKGTAAYAWNDYLLTFHMVPLTALFGGNVWPARRALHEGIQSKQDSLPAGTLGLAKHACKQIRANVLVSAVTVTPEAFCEIVISDG